MLVNSRLLRTSSAHASETALKLNIRLLLILSLMMLAACASQGYRQHVDRGMILPFSAARLDVQTNQKFIMAVPIKDKMPVFPSRTKQASATICIEFVVTSDGRVRDAVQIDNAPDCEHISELTQPFASEAIRAVSEWTFFGAAICEFVEAESECDTATANLRPVSIKLAYRFSFSTSASGNHVKQSNVTR